MEEEGSEGGGREAGRGEKTIPCSWQSRMTPSPSGHGFCSIELLELHMEQD